MEIIAIYTDVYSASSEAMIAIASQKARELKLTNVTFSVGDSYTLPYSSSCFNAVIVSNALHVMVDPSKTLDEIHRVLIKDGIQVFYF